jgi:hypothetical protein
MNHNNTQNRQKSKELTLESSRKLAKSLAACGSRKFNLVLGWGEILID